MALDTLLLEAGISYVVILGVFVLGKAKPATWAAAGIGAFVLGGLYYLSAGFTTAEAGVFTGSLASFIAVEVAISLVLAAVAYVSVLRPLQRGDSGVHIRVWAILLAVLGIPFSIFGTAFILLIGADDAFAKLVRRDKESPYRQQDYYICSKAVAS